MTWGALASPGQTSPESLSSLPRDLRGETDPVISGSWPEWGLCWSSSAACSPGELACTSALVRRAGRTWHVQVCCCWDRRDVALGPWLETEAPARGGAASGPAVSGPGRPAGKGESGALQARALCLGLSTVVPVIVFL